MHSAQPETYGDPFSWSSLKALTSRAGKPKPEAKPKPQPRPAPANNNRPPAKPVIEVHQFQLRGTSRIPRREFLYGRHHIRRYMAALFAAGGLGKSSLLVTDALAMVTGKPLLGDKSERPLRVRQV